MILFLIASNLRLLTGILAAWLRALVKELPPLEIDNITLCQDNLVRHLSDVLTYKSLYSK